MESYKDTAMYFLNEIGKLITKYESEGDYYMDENDNPQLRTSKDVIEDLRKVITPNNNTAHSLLR